MARPRICVSIATSGVERAIEGIRGAEPYEPDLFELRLDYLEGQAGLERIRGATGLPIIATNRRRDQGGRFVESEEERVEGLRRSCQVGFDYVDLEVTTVSLSLVADEMRDLGAKLIVSFHDLHGTPSKETLDGILKDELSYGPDLCKIVGTAESHFDNLTYLNFLRENSDVGLVCFGMGMAGSVSRVLSPIFGSAFTYAAVEAGHESAPGQLTIGALRDIYRSLGV